MELREFVRETLTAIVEGVALAQDGPKGAYICPSYSSVKTNEDTFLTTYGLLATPVRFDVAITAGDSGTIEGGGKISILAASVGGKGATTSEKQTASRVQFTVPVAMPPTSAEPPHFAT